MVNLKVTSKAFENGGIIPIENTADGENVNPEINIEGVPIEAKSLVLINDDPDAPNGTWTHWIVFNIEPNIKQISRNSIPGIEGLNDFKDVRYNGPSPPKGTGVHRYFFKIYALDTKLELEEKASRQEVELGMKGHILAQGELMGTYTRE